MNFSEALHALKHGSKIRRKHWNKKIYFYLDGEFLFNHDGIQDFSIDFENILANDWEEYKEK